MACPVCKSENVLVIENNDIFRCRVCTHWFSALQPRINEFDDKTISADIEVKDALNTIRLDTFNIALDLVADRRSLTGLKHLDIGCSIGHFLSISGQRGTRPAGVEPERAFADVALDSGHCVYRGYFPEALPNNQKYDLISFMDVIGHIPGVVEIAKASLAKMDDDAILMIKTPVADGLFYSIGRLLKFFGMRFLWNRLWQKEFASPQIHYFTPASMDRFAQEIGGQVLSTRRFAALRWRGLWQRMLPGVSMPYWQAIPLYCFLSILLPIINQLPRDSLLVLIGPIQNKS